MAFLQGYPAEVKGSLSDSFQGDIEQIKKYQPVYFGFTTDYAEALEYGTGPLRDMQPTVHGGAYTYDSVWRDIDEWARKKLGMHDKAYRENFVTGVVNRMWEKGLYPHVYFRPALLWLEENLQQQVDMGKSFVEIADEAMRIANTNIMSERIPDLQGISLSMPPRPFTPDSGNLQRSAVIKTLDFDQTYERSQETAEQRFNRITGKIDW